MKLEKVDKEFISNAFHKMDKKEDLLNLLNYSNKRIYGENTIPFELRQLTYYSNPNANKSRYVKFKIKKKSGSNRVIHAPVKGLKALQRALNLILQSVFDPHKSATGFVEDKSIVDNAKIHVGNYYIYNLDLQDFFFSVDQARVWKCLQNKPFNLAIDKQITNLEKTTIDKNGNTDKYEIVNIISALCCTKILVERLDEDGELVKIRKNVLPQGAPTSPIITNIVCQRLDFLLAGVAKRFGLRYSRYADDITFSSLHNVYQKNSEFIIELNRIITEQQFRVNSAKTRLQKEGYRQEVTGLVVNEKVNVKKKYIKQLRLWLNYWERFGYGRANTYFIPQYRTMALSKSSSISNLKEVLEGKLDFLKMVKGANDPVYKKLKQRFDKLNDNEEYTLAAVNVTPKTEVKHKPYETVQFLKYFKYDNEYSFKDLVHRPVDELNFNYLSLVKKANKEFVMLSKSFDDQINLPKKLIKDVQELMISMGSNGVAFYKKTGLHPIDNREIGALIQQFKGNYRFGNEKIESSILSTLILNTAKKREFTNQVDQTTYSFGTADTSGLFNIDQFVFKPDLKRFQAKANFFTWVPNVLTGLSLIIDAILKHSNIDGSRDFESTEKEIVIEIFRRTQHDIIYIDLSILDKNSLFMGDINSLIKNIRRDFFPVFVGLCDFKIQVTSPDEISHECKILPYSDSPETITEPVCGFKYILTFYD